VPRLSVYLITHNEERYLPSCLAAVRDIADQIVVLDDGSTDRTVALARQNGAEVRVRPFDDFGPQKNAALAFTTGEWVLNLDADERITPELAREIRSVVDADGPADGYYLRREVLYLGSRLRFGGAAADWVLRLTRREKTRFSLTPVHAFIEMDGRTGRLRGACDHVKYDNLSQHLAVIDRYTETLAAARIARRRTFAAWHLLRVPWELCYRLIFRLGILDGRPGIIWGTMAAFYAFLKSAKTWRGHRTAAALDLEAAPPHVSPAEELTD
jgi:glycosyltransferase involved in cell wall biosynthesis